MPPTPEHSKGGTTARRLIPVAVSTLQPTRMEFDVYLKREDSGTPALYCRRSAELQEVDIARLLSRGIDTLYVTAADHSAYRDYVRTQLASRRNVSPVETYRMVRDIHRAVFETAFTPGSVGELVELSTDLGREVADTICENELVLGDLFELMEHDDGTYTHSINVCSLAVMLAMRLGISDRTQQRALSAGALLHDLGKRHISRQVLNQPGRLSSAQRHQVEKHPAFGFRDLCYRSDVTWNQLMAVYQHHERVDGTGYPVGLPGQEIHPWARICAIADVFHALTSVRPYRKPLSVAEATSYLQQEAGRAFDEEMVQCWTTMVVSPVSN